MEQTLTAKAQTGIHADTSPQAAFLPLCTQTPGGQPEVWTSQLPPMAGAMSPAKEGNLQVNMGNGHKHLYLLPLEIA